MSLTGSKTDSESLKSSSSPDHCLPVVATPPKSPLAQTPRARLCHLHKWSNFVGYGFNLHAERAKTGQHIGKVDANSPAESAGLKEGDRIIEVNHVNISNENHQQVVKRIRNGIERDNKLITDEVVLLVVDREAETYYRTLNLVIKSDFKNIQKLYTKPMDTTMAKDDLNSNSKNVCNQDEKKLDDVNLMVSPNGTKVTTPLGDATNIEISGEGGLKSVSVASLAKSTDCGDMNEIETKSDENLSDRGSLNKVRLSSASNLSVSSNNQSNSSKGTTPNPQPKNNTDSTATSVANNKEEPPVYSQASIELQAASNHKKMDPFQMSAAEFKTYLMSKGRPDPRVAQVDMRKKFQMFQDM